LKRDNKQVGMMTEMGLQGGVTRSKQWLFLSSQGPWASAAPGACVDLLLTAAVFGEHVTLVFIGNGVLQLQTGQDAGGGGQKVLAKQFPAFELYEVNRICAEAAALQQHGLAVADLVLPVDVLDQGQIRTLLDSSDVIFQF
jgi:tRNA 2-thiouridine synthesizing protein C